MKRLLLAALSCGVAVPAARADEPARASAGALAEALAAAVDLPTPKERATAAAALAARTDLTLEALLDGCRAFGVFAVVEPGWSTVRAPLPVLDKVEGTEIACFVPLAYDPKTPAPLLLYLHGSGGNGGDAKDLWTEVAEKAHLLVVAPTEAGPNEGYRFQERERRAGLAALRWARRRWNVDENRVYVSGVSRGGHMTWDLALRHPDLFAAAAPMIGAPRATTAGGQNNLRYVENLVATPVRDLMGAKDDARAVRDVRLAFERLLALGAKDAKLVEFPSLGHEFEFGAVDWPAWLDVSRRDPSPSRVVRRTATRGEGRVLWAEILGVDPSIGDDVAIPQPPGWAQMSEDAQRKYFVAEVEAKTARLEVSRRAPGQFTAQGMFVKKFRLLLAEGEFEPKKPVVVSWNGGSISRSASPSKSVLLSDFVERFDRTRLPVVEISVP